MARITDKMITDVIKDMVVIVDTREQKNEHILEYLDKKGIPYVIETMKTGDYTCEFPNYENLLLDGQFLVERKGSLDEVAGNFTKGRDRFRKEFDRIGTRQMDMVMENATWKKLLGGSYRSGFAPESYKASLMSFAFRYDVPVWFVERSNAPEVIYSILKYRVMDELKIRQQNEKLVVDE